MVRLIVVFAMVGVLAVSYGQASAQVYEFSKPNVPVNDDSLGRHHHFNLSEGQHSVAARGDTFYAIWWDFRNGIAPVSNSDIYFSRSTDNGRSFLPNLRVNDDTDTMRQEYPSLSRASNGFIHTAWMDKRSGDWRIYYSRSTDGGRSFSSNLRVSDTASYFPMVAGNGLGVVCIAWHDDLGNIWLIRSSNGGQTFGRTVKVNDHYSYYSDNASLSIDSMGRAYLVWTNFESNPRHIYLSRSTDPGDTVFYPGVRVSDSVIRVWDEMNPSLTLDKQGNPYVALIDKRNTGQVPHLYVARSADRGLSFLPNVDVSDNQGNSAMQDPCIALDDSGNVYLVWTDYRNGDRCIYFARSADSTATSFSSNVLVNDTTGLSGMDHYGASVAANERGEAFVTWSDDRVSGSIYVYDIFSSRGIRKPDGISGDIRDFRSMPDIVKCYPNPFSSSTLISYHGPNANKVTMTIFNLLGEEVRCLIASPCGFGSCEAVWKGEDNQGLKVKSGVYFIGVSEVKTGGRFRSSVQLHKCIYLK